MQTSVADLCADALRITSEEVAALHDDADLLPALLARLIIEVRHHGRPAPPGLSDAQRKLVEGLRALYNVGETFTAGELVLLLAQPIGVRENVRTSLLELVTAIDAQRVGTAFGEIVRAGGAAGEVRLVSAGKQQNRQLWCLERL